MKIILSVFLIMLLGLTACSNKSSGGGGGNNNSFVPGKGGNKNGGGAGGGGQPNGNTEQPAGNGNGSQLTCLLHQGAICAEFTGSAWNQNSINQVCGQYQGALNQASCNDQGIVEECILNKGMPEEALVKYYNPISYENAKADCLNAGGMPR